MKAKAVIILYLFVFSACSACAAPDTTATSLPVQTSTSSEQLPAATQRGEVWVPEQGSSWQWDLSETPDLSLDVAVYDLDLFETPVESIQMLHERGIKVICYISVGSWEDWRPDSDDFPKEIIGKRYQGWPGERWLDIRQIDLLAPVMLERLDMCHSKGFDGVEPDNIDGYTNNTGFKLSAEDQLRYNIWLADAAHERGLSIGLKNDPEQAHELVSYFDWALTEDCFAEGWCDWLLPFREAGKAVFAAEYTDTGIELEDVCPLAGELGFSVILKNRDLDHHREVCP